MELEEAFTKAVKYVFFRYFKPNLVCEVVSVDKTKNTCVVKEDASNYQVNDVMLLAVIANPAKKVVIYPKEGSKVTIAFIGRISRSATVIKYSEVDEMELNGSQFGGLVKAEQLVDRMNKQEDKLNEVINKWNSFCSSYMPGSPTTVGTPPSLALETLTEISKTDVDSISNQKVKHG